MTRSRRWTSSRIKYVRRRNVRWTVRIKTKRRSANRSDRRNSRPRTATSNRTVPDLFDNYVRRASPYESRRLPNEFIACAANNKRNAEITRVLFAPETYNGSRLVENTVDRFKRAGFLSSRQSGDNPISHYIYTANGPAPRAYVHLCIYVLRVRRRIITLNCAHVGVAIHTYTDDTAETLKTVQNNGRQSFRGLRRRRYIRAYLAVFVRRYRLDVVAHSLCPYFVTLA